MIISTQGIHASVAAIHQNYGHEDTNKYFQDLDHMTTLVLEVSNNALLVCFTWFVI